MQENAPRSRKDDYATTVLGKLDWVMSQVDITVILGDVNHRPSINDELKVRLIDVLMKHRRAGKKIYWLMGNHDITNMNQETYKKFTMGVVHRAGIVGLARAMNIGPVYFDVVDLKKNPEVPKTDKHPSVLLGHFFLEYPLDSTMSLTREAVAASGFDYLILGHDHEPHPPELVGKTMVIRPGSVSRNTSHAYNLNRQPNYIRMTVKGGEILRVDTVEVPALKPHEVFYEEAFKKANTNTFTFVQNVQTILEGFKRIVESGEARATVRKALDEVGAPEPVKMYLKSLHEQAMLNW